MKAMLFLEFLWSSNWGHSLLWSTKASLNIRC